MREGMNTDDDNKRLFEEIAYHLFTRARFRSRYLYDSMHEKYTISSI